MSTTPKTEKKTISEIFEEDDLFIENEEFWAQRVIDEEYKKQNQKEEQNGISRN
jgi:hypothetical protein